MHFHRSPPLPCVPFIVAAVLNSLLAAETDRIRTKGLDGVMAEPKTSIELFRFIEQSRLLDDEELSALKRLPRVEELQPFNLGVEMIENGLLTSYQAKQLFGGQHDRLAFGDWKVRSSLSNGLVYLAEHRATRQRAALKRWYFSKCNLERGKPRFEHDRLGIDSLDNPILVRLFEFYPEDEWPYFVMEYVEGRNLYDLVRQHGAIPWPQACRCISEAADGLDQQFNLRLQGRFILPTSILADLRGRIRLINIGPYFLDREDGVVIRNGHPDPFEYDCVAPEQLTEDVKDDARVEIYRLGCIFYFLLSGQFPFGEATPCQNLLWRLKKAPPPIRQHCPDVPNDLATILHSMLARWPEGRPQSFREVSRLLTPFAAAQLNERFCSLPSSDEESFVEWFRRREAFANGWPGKLVGWTEQLFAKLTAPTA